MSYIIRKERASETLIARLQTVQQVIFRWKHQSTPKVFPALPADLSALIPGNFPRLSKPEFLGDIFTSS